MLTLTPSNAWGVPGCMFALVFCFPSEQVFMILIKAIYLSVSMTSNPFWGHRSAVQAKRKEFPRPGFVLSAHNWAVKDGVYVGLTKKAKHTHQYIASKELSVHCFVVVVGI